eukprot:Blabericola_migrator_1__10766@NODE_617_length_7255_cov_83_500696_g450_i0_p5_GENE_NODE_617_length_7255_cov_83_500696_g450_i0NODE_617_length_7255_cov_83_500696_g450_i0_p5_ORF_typecomplete_len325_score55_87SRAP/PF02586_14/1_8e42_NODE_617_length_7255_cov_83_500696_g450_i042835257
MCGRLCCALRPVAALQHARCDVYDPQVIDFVPRYNVGPQSHVLLAYEKGVRIMTLARWSLQPSFVTNVPDRGFRYSTFNARLEDVETKVLYSRLLDTQRCVIFADGFYEWRQADKTPFYFTYADDVLPAPIDTHGKAETALDKSGRFKLVEEFEQNWLETHPDDKEVVNSSPPLCFAGLYEMSKGDPLSLSCTILTMSSKETPMEKLHHRMPCVLSSEMASKWCLMTIPFQDLKQELEADCINTMTHSLRSHQVAKDVGNVKNQGPHLIEKVGATSSRKGPLDYFFQIKQKSEATSAEGKISDESRKRKGETSQGVPELKIPRI